LTSAHGCESIVTERVTALGVATVVIWLSLGGSAKKPGPLKKKISGIIRSGTLMQKMRRARQKPNAAKLSGYTSAEETARALRDMSNVAEPPNVDKSIDYNKLTDEQKIRLRAAGYKILDIL
jgi:hypothetical protein